MHSISPYSVRCFNKNGPKNDKYFKLNRVGSKDVLELLNNFIESKAVNINRDLDSKQAYIFEGVTYEANARKIYGWFKVGSYGTSGEIHDINSGNVDFIKTINNADLIRHYFQFHLPLDYNEGFCIFHSFRGRGVKTLFSKIFDPYFNPLTDSNLQFNALAYDEAFQAWSNANIKELRVTNFSGLTDISDAIKKMGHSEIEIRIKPKRGNKAMGKFSNFFAKDSDENKLVELLTPLGEKVKTVVELGGRKRIFNVGADVENSVCQIEIDDTVTLIGGLPELNSLHKWVNDILKEYVDTLYHRVK